MKSIATSQAPAAIGPYAQAISSGGFVYCSGQIGIDPANGQLVGSEIESQTRQVFKNLKAVLCKSGLSLNRVVKTTVFLKKMDDFPKMNAVYEDCFGDHKPARSTVEVSGLPKDALIEIECVAAKR